MFSDSIDLLQIMLLSLLCMPLLGATVLAFFVSRDNKQSAQKIYQTVVWFTLLVTIMLPAALNNPTVSQSFSFPWLPELGINLEFAVDSLTFLLVLITTCVFLLFAIIDRKGDRSRYAAYLLLEFALISMFITENLVVFYLSYELILIPVIYLIIKEGSVAVRKSLFTFFLYTFAGSLALLSAIIYLGVIHNLEYGVVSFNLGDLLRITLNDDEQLYLMLCFVIAFAIKAPVFPFHSWLPNTYTNLPKGLIVIVPALLFQAGLYGFYRFALILFPQAILDHSDLFIIAALISIVYGALLAMIQPNFTRTIAYASISHIGFSVLGLSIFSFSAHVGGLYLIFSHVLIAFGLFFLGQIMFERVRSDQYKDLGGIAQLAPKFTFYLVAFSFAAVSLPLTFSFVGEFMVIEAAFRQHYLFAIFALLGVILGAVYMLGACQKILYGPISQVKKFKDLNPEELLVLRVLLLMIVANGVYPQMLTKLIEPVAARQLNAIERRVNYEPKLKLQQELRLPQGLIRASYDPLLPVTISETKDSDNAQ